MVKSWNDSITREMNEIESTLLAVVDSQSEELREMCAHVVTAGGKKIRPALCILSHYACGGKNTQRAIEIGSAFEIVHSATLIHDDINDQSEIRRGRKALHKKYSVSKAIIAGDFLLVKGFFLLGSATEEIVRIISETAAGMSESELLQKKFEHDKNVTEGDYYKIIRGKTALLLAASAKSGASLANASIATMKAIGDYALNLGMAFQIIDDILDVIGDDKITGKGVGSDLTESKPTLPTILAMSDPKYGGRVTELYTKGSITDEEVKEGIELIRKTNAIEICRQKAKVYIELAKTSLDRITDSEYKQSMISLADYVVSRDR